MAVAVPTSEPSSLTAGDTLSFTKSLPDYLPSDGWALSYGLQGGADGLTEITFSSSTNTGSVFSILVTATTTKDYEPGAYIWAAYVTKSGERHTVARGSMSILADPSAAPGETHATRTLAIIEAALEGRIPRGLEQYTIDGQSITKMPIEMLAKLRNQYAAEVAAEQASANAAAGIKPRRRIGFRFVKP